MLLSKLQYLFALPFVVSAADIDSALPASKPSTPSHSLSAQTLFQFEKVGTWLENIAVRPNGDLLVTLLLPNASLYTLKRPYSTHREFSLLHTFDDASGLLGITETETDTYAILSLQSSNISASGSGGCTVWGVSLVQDSLNVRKIANLPDVMVPNGITSIPGSFAVLVADSIGGTVTRCDTRTGICETVLKVPETVPVPNSTQVLGINGIHYREGYISWSHSGLDTIFRIRVDRQGYPAANSKIEALGTVDAVFIDDFVVDNAGRFWIAANPNNSIILLGRDGSSNVVAGSLTELTVAGCTAAAFGRTVQDNRTLYVVTSGALRAPVNGTVSEPAKVVALDTSKCA
jgi:sugar lactone lactonase YvrE